MSSSEPGWVGYGGAPAPAALAAATPATAVVPRKKGLYDKHRDGYGRMRVTGDLRELCTITQGAIERLIALSSHARNGDTWTSGAMINYLTYTWVKQMQEENVAEFSVRHLSKASRQPPTGQQIRDLIDNDGLSLEFYVMNTGLTDENLDHIYITVCQVPPPAVLQLPFGVSNRTNEWALEACHIFTKGIYESHGSCFVRLMHKILSQAKGEAEFLHADYRGVAQVGTGNFPRSLLHVYCPNGAMTVENNVTKLAPPSYFAARDPDLLFDSNLFIDKNEKHVVLERASRLVAARVLDIEELVYWQETPGTTRPGLPAHQQWDLLRDEDLIEKPALQMLINGSKTNVYLLMTRNNGRHDHYVYVFRRGDQGLRSACIAMQAWIEESEKLCKQNYSLAAPQIFFTKKIEPGLSPGDKVEVDARDKDKFYAGKITEAYVDGTYDIVCDDWKWYGVPKVNIRKPGGGVLESYSKGDKIEGNHLGRGTFYLGTISKDHGDGTYDIIYDGERETNVPERLINKLQQVYVGRKQMILPLFCGTSKAVLALTLDYIAHPPHGAPLAPDPTYPRYRVGTVLTKRMGRGNARLITTPQVPWLNEPP